MNKSKYRKEILIERKYLKFYFSHAIDRVRKL